MRDSMTINFEKWKRPIWIYAVDSRTCGKKVLLGYEEGNDITGDVVVIEVEEAEFWG